MAIREIVVEVSHKDLVRWLVSEGHAPKECSGWPVSRAEEVNDGYLDVELTRPDEETEDG